MMRVWTGDSRREEELGRRREDDELFSASTYVPVALRRGRAGTVSGVGSQVPVPIQQGERVTAWEGRQGGIAAIATEKDEQWYWRSPSPSPTSPSSSEEHIGMLSSSSAYVLPSSSSARPSPHIPVSPSSRNPHLHYAPTTRDQDEARSDSPLLGFGSDSSSPPRSPVPPPSSHSLQPPPHLEDVKAAHRRSKSSEDTYDFPRTPGPEDGFLDAGSAFGAEDGMLFYPLPLFVSVHFPFPPVLDMEMTEKLTFSLLDVGVTHSPSTKEKERDRNPLLFPGKGYKRDLPSGLDEVPLDSERLVYNTSSAHPISYLQPQPQSYGSPAFPTQHGKTASFFRDDSVQHQFAYIPDDGSATYVVDVISPFAFVILCFRPRYASLSLRPRYSLSPNQSTRTHRSARSQRTNLSLSPLLGKLNNPPPRSPFKGQDAQYAASPTVLVQLSSEGGKLSYITYDQEKHEGGQWTEVMGWKGAENTPESSASGNGNGGNLNGANGGKGGGANGTADLNVPAEVLGGFFLHVDEEHLAGLIVVFCAWRHAASCFAATEDYTIEQASGHLILHATLANCTRNLLRVDTIHSLGTQSDDFGLARALSSIANALSSSGTLLLETLSLGDVVFDKENFLQREQERADWKSRPVLSRLKLLEVRGLSEKFGTRAPLEYIEPRAMRLREAGERTGEGDKLR
ncbi:hypothetical protein NMY22_g17521 [Coprinellus aureogranulatus]|nr:hypothetical protein NMY22_g17521 [Coprinellus aureogranulatus]